MVAHEGDTGDLLCSAFVFPKGKTAFSQLFWKILRNCGIFYTVLSLIARVGYTYVSYMYALGFIPTLVAHVALARSDVLVFRSHARQTTTC